MSADPRCPLCNGRHLMGACSDTLETPVVLITLDEEGDYVARDLLRPGCIIHGDTEAIALQRLIEIRPDYDEMDETR